MDARKIVSSHTNEFRQPPGLTPRDRSVDGPLLGNGDMGVAIGGPPAALEFYLCKNDFWRLQHQYGESSPLPLGHLSIALPGLEGASYHVTQDLLTATTTGVFETSTGRVHLTAYVAAGSNRLVLALRADGDAFEGTVCLKVNEGRNSENESGCRGPVAWGSRAFTAGVDLPTGAAAAWVWLGWEATSEAQHPTSNIEHPTSNAQQFVLEPGETKTLVLAMESLFKHEDYVGAAIANVDGIGELADVRRDHEAWWADYWDKSGVSIGDPVIEKHYYLSLYIMGSCSRDIDFPPPLYGWTTEDEPLCLGDYHLNYNHEAPFYGLARANRLEQADPHDTPLLDFMERAASHCREMYGHEGGIYPVGIGPKGIEVSYNSWRTFPNGVCRVEHGGYFHGQRTNGSYALVNVAPRWTCTYDLDYARRVYPFVLLITTFWEHYLTWDEAGQRFVIENDSANEGSGPDRNWCMSLALCRMTFELALDMSRELGCDADRHAAWEHILKHLSGYIFFEQDGKTFIRKTENGEAGTAFQHVYPAGDIHLDSDPKLLEAARNVVEQGGAWESFNQTCSFYPGAVRVGYDPEIILAKLRSYVADCRPNGFYQPKNMHGIENCSTVPNTINEMLCMGHKGVIRLFRVWPKNQDAAFVNIRCWGAFLVSAALRDGVVQDVTIVSEKGRECTVVNPWAPESVQLVRNGKRAECLAGERVTFGTKPGEEIGLERGTGTTTEGEDGSESL
jgi:alpha-L-fucosidase 2